MANQEYDYFGESYCHVASHHTFGGRGGEEIEQLERSGSGKNRQKHSKGCQ